MKRNGLFLSILLLAAVTLAAYSAYWYWGARELTRFANERLQSWDGDGQTVSHAEPGISGFPGIIRVTYPTVMAADADGKWRWQGQEIELSAQPWKPLEFRGALKGRQDLSLPLDGRMVDLVLSAERADILTHFDLQGRLSGVELELAQLLAEAPDLDETLTAEYFYLGVEDLTASDKVAAVLRTKIEKLALPKAWDGPMGRALKQFQTKLTIVERFPVADLRSSLAGWQKKGGRLDIDWLNVDWGQLGLQASGQLAMDPEYRLEGKLDGRVAGLGETLEEFGDRGLIDPKMARLAAAGARLFSLQRNSDGRPAASLPILLDQGDLILGPLKLASLPPIFGVERQAAARSNEPLKAPAPRRNFPKTEDGILPVPAPPVMVEELPPPTPKPLLTLPAAKEPNRNPD